MNSTNVVTRLESVRSLLADDVSRKIFDIRLQYAIDRDETRLTDELFALGGSVTVCHSWTAFVRSILRSARSLYSGQKMMAFSHIKH